jgi:hypothetical protein
VQGLWAQIREVERLPYSQFLAYVDQNKVDNLTITAGTSPSQ